MRALLTAVLLSGAFALSCGDEESPIATTMTPLPPALIAAAPSPAEAPTTSPTPSPEALPSLAEALAGGETLAQRPVGRPNLVYGIKEGKHVRVFLRDVASGNEILVLEYDEDVEAKHSGNSWQEEPAAIDVAGSGILVYERGFDVQTYDVRSGMDRLILRASPRDSSLPSNNWSTPGGLELCCGYHLAQPSFSPDGRFVAFLMSLREGAVVAIAATDGSSVCEVLGESSTSAPPMDRDFSWSLDNRLVIPSRGEYAALGLYVTSDPATCATSLSAEITRYPFEMTAAWTPDGLAIALAVQQYDPDDGELTLFRKGTAQALLEDVFISGLLFSPDTRYIYYVESESVPARNPSPEVLKRYDLQSAEAVEIAGIPNGWSARPESWSSDGLLVLQLSATQVPRSPYRSTNNRIALLDPETGGVVYASAASDFTRFAGFLP